MAEDADQNGTDQNDANEPPPKKPELTPTRVFLRGVAVSLPTILTIVVLIWVLNFVAKYIITPATWTVKYTMSQFVDESVPSDKLIRLDSPPSLDFCQTNYLVSRDLSVRFRNFVAEQKSWGDSQRAEATNDTSTDLRSVRLQRQTDWLQTEAEKVTSEVYIQLGSSAVPYPVYAEVAQYLPPGQIPSSSRALYMEYVAHKYFKSLFHLSLLTVVLIIFILYFTGQFVSAKLGGLLVRLIEVKVLGRLPVVRNIYGSVKQVTDFLLTENQPVEYRRVAAVQYTRKGVWAIGFVTGESMMQISIGAGEPCVSVFVPTSPMPMTGFTINIPRREVLDLDISVEQAMQFCISCGVLSPAHQKMTPEKFKEFVEQGLIRANVSTPQYLPGQAAVPGQMPHSSSQIDDEGDDD